MLPFEDRYTRQRRLGEVGASGQERLLAARLVLPDHEGGEIEREYLARAGIGSVEVDPSATAAPFPFASEFEFEHSRAFARGTWSALVNIRKVLGLSVRRSST
jgi:hypothetical protein